MRKAQRYLAGILEALQLVAADFDTQVRVLPEFVHVPDEVLNEYANAFLLARQFLEAGLVNDPQFAKLEELDQAMDSLMPSSDYEVALEQMKTGPEWKQVRNKAAEVLRALGQIKRQPDLTHITYVQGDA